MTTIDWIIICATVAIGGAFISWAITYSVMDNSKQRKCLHNFTEVIRLDVPGVHKVAYICEKCGKVKKVYL